MLKNNSLLILAILLYLTLTFTNFITGNHFLFNLEPYPDGLLYLVPPFSFTHGEGWLIATVGDKLVPWVPPLYSILLIPFFLVTNQISVYYLVNILLGVWTLFLLFWIVKKATHQTSIATASLYLYLAHVIPIWIASLPLSENAALPLVLTAIALLLVRFRNIRWGVLTAIIISSLVFVRYDLALVSITLGFTVCYQLWSTKAKSILAYFLSTTLLMALLFAGFQQVTPYPITNLLQPLSAASSQAEITAFNVTRFPQAASFYSNALLGKETRILWVTTPIIGFGLWLLIVQLLVYWRKIKHAQAQIISLLTLVVGAVVGPHLFFYSLDARYSVLALPVLVILSGIGFSYLKEKTNRFLSWGVFAVVLLSTVISQGTLWKSTLAANWLQRSRGWNMIAVTELTAAVTENQSENATLITSLPPQLFTLYGKKTIKTAPLSIHQEFLSKDQNVWELEFEQRPVKQSYLLSKYHSLVQSGATVYITNAYITQQAAVIADFESFELEFELVLIRSGCENTCNLYQLQEKKATIDADVI